MAEMRRVQLHPGAKAKGHGVVTSTFNFEGKRYFLDGTNMLNVDLAVANAWTTADSNVVTLPER